MISQPFYHKCVCATGDLVDGGTPGAIMNNLPLEATWLCFASIPSWQLDGWAYLHSVPWYPKWGTDKPLHNGVYRRISCRWNHFLIDALCLTTPTSGKLELLISTSTMEKLGFLCRSTSQDCLSSKQWRYKSPSKIRRSITFYEKIAWKHS